ncbi:MAG: hypothetical protein U1E92_02350 [Moraxella osloensis]
MGDRLIAGDSTSAQDWQAWQGYTVSQTGYIDPFSHPSARVYFCAAPR